jgi:DNA-binding IclR family transcriptional regulator
VSRPEGPDLDPAESVVGMASAGSQIAVVGKAVLVLETLLDCPDGATPTDVATRLGMSRSTAFRLLTSLEHAGLLDRDPGTGQYQLGLRFLVFGEVVRERLDLVRIAESTMRQLRDELGQTVYLSVRDSWGAICLHRLSGTDVDVLAWKTGRWLPFHSGAGPRALLAALPHQDLTTYLGLPQERPTRQGALSTQDLVRIIEETRERGWSFNPEEITEGVSSLGAVVRSSEGAPMCALSVAGLTIAYQGPRLTKVAAAVIGAAAELSRKIDGR